MTAITMDKTQKKAAIVAGASFLLSIPIMIVPFFAISLRLNVPGNVVETARNILANESLFRLNIASNLIVVFNMLILLTALYVILKPVNRTLSLISLFSRMIYAVTWGITALNMLGALRFLTDDSFHSAFKSGQAQAMMWVKLSTDAYYIGLPFWGLASVIICYLWFKSDYISKILAGLGMITSIWAVICSFAYLILPNFNTIVDPDLYDFPLFIFEIFLGVRLLIIGLKRDRPIQAKSAH